MVKNQEFSDVVTKREEAFVQEILKGSTQVDAHRNAYPNNMTDKQRYEAASLIIKKPKVKQRLNELKQLIDAPIIEKIKIDREYITNGILDAIQMATLKEDSGNILKGLAQLAQMYDLNEDKQNDRIFSNKERQALIDNYRNRIIDVTLSTMGK